MFTWNLRFFTDSEGVVKELHWILYVDIDGKKHKGTAGSVALPAPEEGSFIPYESISPEQALEWLVAQNDEGWKEATEVATLASVERKLSPALTEGVPAAWAS